MRTLFKKKNETTARDRVVVRSELEALEADAEAQAKRMNAEKEQAKAAEVKARAELERASSERLRVSRSWGNVFRVIDAKKRDLRMELERSAPAEIDEFIDEYLAGLKSELDRVAPNNRTQRVHDKNRSWDRATHSTYPAIQARAEAIVKARQQALELRYHALPQEELIARLEAIANTIPEIDMVKLK